MAKALAFPRWERASGVIERCAVEAALEALEDQAGEGLNGSLDHLPSGSNLGVTFDER